MRYLLFVRRAHLTICLLLALALCPTPWVHAAPLTYQRLESARVPWLPAKTVNLKPKVLENQRRLLLTPQGRTTLLSKLKEKPAAYRPAILKTMYHTMLSTMRSNLPAAQRASLCQQLSRQFGEFAQEVRRVPGMATKERVAFGRVYHRFLKDDVLMQELAREREQQYQHKKAVVATGMGQKKKAAAQPTQKASSTVTKVEWQIPDPVQRNKLVSKPVKAVTYSLTGYKDQTKTALERYERQLRRMRLVESRTFSPRFVQKQKKALQAEKKKLEAVTRRMVGSVPRVTEAKLLNAFVWPESAVRVERVKRDPVASLPGDKSPLWKVNKQGLTLKNTKKGLRLQATFETAITNDAVLQAFKSSIETVWNGPVRTTSGKRNLKTVVQFRRVGTEADFTEGSLRLVEGRKSCANKGNIYLSRCFSSTTPAHEFGHTLGLRDAYKTLYDPKARTFVEVQDRSTLMGTHNAPASCNTMTAACRTLLQR